MLRSKYLWAYEAVVACCCFFLLHGMGQLSKLLICFGEYFLFKNTIKKIPPNDIFRHLVTRIVFIYLFSFVLAYTLSSSVKKLEMFVRVFLFVHVLCVCALRMCYFIALKLSILWNIFILFGHTRAQQLFLAYEYICGYIDPRESLFMRMNTVNEVSSASTNKHLLTAATGKVYMKPNVNAFRIPQRYCY